MRRTPPPLLLLLLLLSLPVLMLPSLPLLLSSVPDAVLLSTAVLLACLLELLDESPVLEACAELLPCAELLLPPLCPVLLLLLFFTAALLLLAAVLLELLLPALLEWPVLLLAGLVPLEDNAGLLGPVLLLLLVSASGSGLNLMYHTGVQ